MNRSKWTHKAKNQFGRSVDEDHRAERARNSFGRDICRHCGDYIVRREETPQ